MSIKHLGGDRYMVRVYNPHGAREYRKVVVGKRAAQAHEAEMKTKLARGTLVDPGAGKETFREYATRQIAARSLAPSTRKRYARDCDRLLFPVWGHRELRSLRHTDARALEAHVRSHAQNASVVNVLVLARSLMRSAVLDGLIDRNPFAGMRLERARGRSREMPTWPEVRALAADTAWETALLVALLAGSGLRGGELCGLPVAEVDFLRQRLKVTWQLQWMTEADARTLALPHGGPYLRPAKSEAGADRVVPLPAFALEAASRLAAMHADADPVTLPVGAPGAERTETVRLLLGRPLHPSSLSNRIAKASARRGTGWSPHMLRHLYATTLEQGGVPLRTVQAVLGHEPQGVTLGVYVGVTPESLERVRAVLDGTWDGAASQAASRTQLGKARLAGSNAIN